MIMVESSTRYAEDGTGSRRPCWRCGSVAPPVYLDYSGQPSAVRFFYPLLPHLPSPQTEKNFWLIMTDLMMREGKRCVIMLPIWWIAGNMKKVLVR